MSGTTRRQRRRQLRGDREDDRRLKRMLKLNKQQARAVQRHDRSCLSCGRIWGCNCGPIDGYMVL